jgi:hypothetical protein
MPIQFEEKRDFIRMAANHEMQFREVDNGQPQQATCVNLSASGIMFTTEQSIATGTQLEVSITPQYSVVSPFRAVIEVVRSQPNGVAGRFAVAGKITALHAA